MNGIVLLIAAAVILIVLLIALVLLLHANHREEINRTNKKIILQGGKNVNPDAIARGDGIIGEDMEKDLTVVKRAGHKQGMCIQELCLTELKSQKVYRSRICNRQILIGRMESSEQRSEEGILRVNDRKVSHVHCRIYQQNESYLVEDCQSTNYTWLNGRKVTAPIELKSGDMLRLANKVYQVRFVKVYTG